MEMISYKCPHCGANLEVGFGARRVVCDYCDSVIMIEDAATRAADAEEEGYRFEKGRQRARQESYEYREEVYEYDDDYRSNDPRNRDYGYNGDYNAGYNANYEAHMVSDRSRTVALLLLIFLGVFGAHRFYVGKIGSGILYIFTAAIFGFGWIYDFVTILLGSFRDSRGLRVENW